MKLDKKNAGFSLVELVVVIAIMAVLVGVLAPTMLHYIEKTKERKDAQAIGEFINELYISASDLDNWNGISGDMVFSYDSATECLSTVPVVNGTSNANNFSQEVAEVVGGDIKLVSKQWQEANLTISVSPVWDTIHVSGNLPEGYDFSNVTIVP